MAEFTKEEEVWMRALVAAIRLQGMKDGVAPITYADSCLEEFKKRFPKNKSGDKWHDENGRLMN